MRTFEQVRDEGAIFGELLVFGSSITAFEFGTSDDGVLVLTDCAVEEGMDEHGGVVSSLTGEGEGKGDR